VIAESWALTDVGKHRETNEDCFFVDPDNRLVLVLDGMGGHKAGEVASRLAMEIINEFFRSNVLKNSDDIEIIEEYDPSFTFPTNLFRQAVFEANRAVLRKSIDNNAYHGMGCTLAGMAIQDFTVSIINVGDSRVYLIRNNDIEQISKDHTLAEDQVERGVMSREEARQSQLRHILSSVIGVDSRIRIHMDELAVMPGDIFLLCTDGLTAVMSDSEILEEVLREMPGPETLERLIEEVNQRGGPDNTTVTLTIFRGESAPGELES
jgi:PPM family protein phosphatase